VEENVDYAQEMVTLLSNMNTYAKKKNSNFAMISNGGYHLYHPDAKKTTQTAMLNAIDGALIEEVFDDNDSSAMKKALQAAMNTGKKAFDIEYDGGAHEYNDAAGNLGILCYSSEEDDLSTIPAFTTTKYDSGKLADVQNFMAILDPANYSKKTDYLAALRNTDYDLIFVDLFFGEDSEGNPKPLSKSEVTSLKTKKNGGSRMVCAYISVGEAENYRYYWDPAWNKAASRPDWICEENKSWKGNFKVKYWRQEWQRILYGFSDSYLDKILSAGFDGVYLDVIDAYEYFEKK
jgi:cysteinyl-tRNA synthetase